MMGQVYALPSPNKRKPPAPPATPAREPQPFEVEHFRQWALGIILDTGEPWVLEPFQLAFAADLFAGSPECWLVVPEGNGKTTLLAGIALYHCEYRPFAVVPWAAASREQAEIGYRQAEGMVLRSPRLHALVHSDIQQAKGKRKTDVPRFLCLEGYRRINHHGGGRIQVFAADDRTGDGIIPTLGIIDEPHRQRDLSLYRTWSGKLLKRQGQIAAISTSGEPGSDFELTRARIVEAAGERTVTGSFTRVKADRIVLHQWAVPEEADPEDLEAVKAANPFTGITIETLTAKRQSPTMTLHHWLRFVCNRPTQDSDVWLGPNGAAVWAGLLDPWEFEDGAPTWVGVDIAIKHDTSAVVALQRREDGRFHAQCRIFRPAPGQPVDTTDVMQHIRELGALYDLKAVSFDPRFFDVPAKMLEDEGVLMVEVPQSVERMTPAVLGLYEAINTGRISHDDDVAFTTQILSGVPRYNERGFTLAKSKSRGKIDAAVALALAYDRARDEPQAVTFVPFD
jgi:phage terminase large subunit-like protein